MKSPSVLTVLDVVTMARAVSKNIEPGRWVPCRPEGDHSIPGRFRAAWLVFTGRADALIWEKQ